jgi:hypothetical protein
MTKRTRIVMTVFPLPDEAFDLPRHILIAYADLGASELLRPSEMRIRKIMAL